MDFMELMRDTTRFLREAQYLTERNHRLFLGTERTNILQPRPNLVEMHCFSCRPTYLVILKILRSLSALSTLIPNDMPGLKKPQTTSKMLPTMTCKTHQTHTTKNHSLQAPAAHNSFLSGVNESKCGHFGVFNTLSNLCGTVIDPNALSAMFGVLEDLKITAAAVAFSTLLVQLKKDVSPSHKRCLEDVITHLKLEQLKFNYSRLNQKVL